METQWNKKREHMLKEFARRLLRAGAGGHRGQCDLFKNWLKIRG